MFFTNTQKKRIVNELRKLSKHSLAKDLIKPLEIAEKDRAILYLTRNGLEEHWEWHSSGPRDSFNAFDSCESTSSVNVIETDEEFAGIAKKYDLTEWTVMTILAKLRF